MVANDSTLRARATRPAARVLVVDDHDDCRETTMELLALHGHLAVPARNGMEAVETAIAHPPDLVLMDLVLPDITGHDAARQILADGRCGRPVVIALTGLSSESSRLLSDHAGMAMHLVKPVPTGLLLAIVDAMALRRARRTC